MAIECLTMNGVTTAGVRNESWDRYREQPSDLVITICDHAARQNCPMFSNDPHRIHWNIPDPVLATETGEQRTSIFQATFEQLRARIEKLVLAIDACGNGASLPAELRSLTDKAAD